jgi:predicted PurR-regulated permease PerM
VLLRVITAVVVIAALRLGKELVIPLTLAVLLSFLFAYPVSWLERLRLGRTLSVAIVLVLAYSAAGGMIWVGTQQLAEIVIRLPGYQENIHNRLQKLRNPAGSGLAKAAQSIQQIQAELSPSEAAAKQQNAALKARTRAGAHQPSTVTPVPVQVVKEKPGILDALGLISGSVVRFFGTAFAAAILTLFLLLRRGDLRNRLFRLFGQRQINVVTTAMDDAASRVSRYLLTQSIVNGTFGLLLGVGLFLIGVPYPVFWGVIAALLRFIPYVGTLTAGLCPFVLSLAVFEGWKQPLLSLGLFAAIELTTSGVVEPWLYATRTGISSLAILLSAAFWTILWGPIGLIVSTPLTVLVSVLGRYIPQLEFLYILLGDEPVLPPHAYYYQRLLAMDEEEARSVAENYLKQKPLIELYDSVLIPALAMAEQDRHENHLDDQRQKFIIDTTRELIEELGEEQTAGSPDRDVAPASAPQLSILCVPVRDEADQLAGLMLAQILRQSGHPAEAIPSGFIEEILAKVTQARPNILCISALPPFAIGHARSLCRRARQRCPNIKAVVGLWGSEADPKTVQRRLGSGCSEYVVHTLAEARLQSRLFTEQVQTSSEPSAPQTPTADQESEPQVVEQA